MMADDYHQQYYGPRGAPHGFLMAVVLGLVIAGPVFLGEDGGEAVKEALKELLGPMGFLLLPVGLVIVIRVLSSDRGAAALTDVFYLGGRPDTVHRAGGSPVGVALFLLVIVMLLYYRVSLFGGDAGDDE
ncbi:hypothetical protein PR202_gb21996 [Eleusine coracana subsp. coracana]|uniref:Uncharacterized protein n=1 Tax=Eleusine coracana subsp. coracana TaxID=191504 RepID=A0AAV5FCJ9_ELECO|nr:hypothetical protein QOZ80_7BG0612590 [Eleusine coracana subsp. coracana]KAK3128017.1 hypothetical protein QOZ80_7AG0581520 [Eleusine coracana subsp. coracana]GJN33398.1 hypothetical protein PR202_gb21995 [Eleusine coracana subsp. coracana]GJN33399.1 hypothetical protein PR202_gb21996 [Eleusine coracana subsp. coracana]